MTGMTDVGALIDAARKASRDTRAPAPVLLGRLADALAEQQQETERIREVARPLIEEIEAVGTPALGTFERFVAALAESGDGG